MMAMVAIAAMVGASLAFVGSAPAITGVSIQGSASCNTTTGEYQVTWVVTNPQAESVTITFASMTPPPAGTVLTGQFTSPIAPSGQATASGTVPGASTNAHLALDLTVGSDPTTVTGDKDLPLAGTCQIAPGLNSLQVGPSAAGPGEAVTISGAGCGVPTTNGTAAIFDIGGTVTGSIAFDPELVFGPVTAGPDGNWSTSIVVPLGTPAGSYEVRAHCAVAVAPISLTAFSAVPASKRAQATAPTGFAYATKYLTVVSAVTATPRQTG
jgi:hypothetical protein